MGMSREGADVSATEVTIPLGNLMRIFPIYIPEGIGVAKELPFNYPPVRAGKPDHQGQTILMPCMNRLRTAGTVGKFMLVDQLVMKTVYLEVHQTKQGH